MPDLIEKYFKEDLTEAERQALRKELLTSDNAAESFGERAEEVYRALGLPEPRWTGPDRFRPAPSSDRWKWLGLGIIFAGIFGTMGWFLWKGIEAPRMVVSEPRLDITPVLSHHLKPVRKIKADSPDESLAGGQVRPSGLRPGL